MSRRRCEVCGREDILSFKCNYCGKTLCADHHLPENHNCASQPREAPPYASPGVSLSKETLSELRQFEEQAKKKKGSDLKRKVRKIVVGIVMGFLKVLAFSIFTIVTMLPTILYLVMMTLPGYQSTLAVLYVFRPDFLLWGIIIPNLGYLIAWVVVVYKVLRKRGKWWYYLILLGFGLWNWWNLPRTIWWFEFFRGIFGG